MEVVGRGRVVSFCSCFLFFLSTASGGKQRGESCVFYFTFFGPISSVAPLPHCQFRRSWDRGNGGLAEAGNSRVVFGELLVLLTYFVFTLPRSHLVLARPVF